MNLVNILSIYFIVSMLTYMFTVLILDATGYKPGDLKSIFVFQYELYKNFKDKLNIFGIIILEAIATISTFGASVFMFVTGVVVCVFIMIWKLFCFIFKKR